MWFAIKTELTTVIIALLFAIPMILTGLIMLMPANSSQAAPRLAGLPDPGCELDAGPNLVTYGERLTTETTTQPTPTPQQVHVTVHEGDRLKAGRIVACHAQLHGATVTEGWNGYLIQFPERWQPALVDLRPWFDDSEHGSPNLSWKLKAERQLTAGYVGWARSASYELAAAASAQGPTVQAQSLTRNVQISLSERPEGVLSDESAKTWGWLLLVAGAIITVGLFGWIATCR